MQNLFKKLKNKVTGKAEPTPDNETMTIVSDSSFKSSLTSMSSMSSPFKTPNQFNKLSSKTLKDLY